jgi:hypothetical protein
MHDDGHYRVDEAHAEVVHAFRALWVWKQAFGNAISAIENARDLNENAGAAAVDAIVRTIAYLWPTMGIWLVARSPSDAVRSSLLVDLAARLQNWRPDGDTGLYLRPSQRRTLLREAAERGVALSTVIREQLPGAVLCAIAERDDLPDLRALRSRTLRLLVRRDEKPRLRSDSSNPNLMAPPPGWSPSEPMACFLTWLSGGGKMPQALRFEQDALDALIVRELQATLETQAGELPVRSREILSILLERWRTDCERPTSAEIGAKLGITPSTVRVELRQLRKKLMSLLDDASFDEH